MLTLPDTIRSLAREQQGLVTRRQLYDAGVTSAQVRWAAQRNWRLVHRDVFSLTTGRLDPLQQLHAAQLFAGPDAHLASLSAVRWHGVSAVPDDGVRRFLVPWNRDGRNAPGVAVRRTKRMETRPWYRGPLTVTSPARAVVDAARLLRGDDVRALIFEAVQRRIVRLDQLVVEVEAGAVRGSAAVRAAVEEVAGGAWSLPESDLADVFASSRILPTPLFNPVLTGPDGSALPSPDALFVEAFLAVQVHSRRHHLFEDDWERTLRADTALGAAGIPLMAFSPHTIRSDGARLLQSVERAYLSRLGAVPPPGVIWSRRPV
ncbi:hypothetical protein AB1207_01385 [Kineococcus endophyticus]|uniref:Transcriptional regulator, AbiEi antitoxin, Type IV TA system n=1 Tax=Kineococcus endophyticus TaxID=1181883 RepID=A0ABV3P1A8_9ACTN